ncbi:L-seryl-tRNA(Sec) kinase isoform X2 [Microtus oregoni]|uniref:L-seryl-tRNA(Sec) kinase isoform X2 n=1 Tax=Microtus oregoni TaxID=111838 RepID=UPI001BB15CE0|nr:L-seryl-tRNA(Sec) kinase isoform X2 [Microtus oregoni]
MILLVVNLTQGSFKSVQKVRKEEPMPPGPGVLELGTADTSASLGPEGAWTKASFPGPLVPPLSPEGVAWCWCTARAQQAQRFLQAAAEDMKTAAAAGEVSVDGRPKLALCVLCGLPAAGKSTFARALALRLRQERSWAVGVLSYDDVLPPALPDDVSTQPRPSQWKMFRQELLKHLECFLVAVISGGQMSAPPNRTETMWEDFITCLKKQDLIFSAAHEAQPCQLLAKTAASRRLFLVLDDNFYYQSMRYEVYQLARKYSLGFCQLFLDCPLETCLLRNGQRPQPLPNETIRLMERKIEKPNSEKNAWEHNSLVIQSSSCSLEASLEVTDLLLTALENPIKCVEDNTEQKTELFVLLTSSIKLMKHSAEPSLRQ